jgi:hypothetical protein
VFENKVLRKISGTRKNETSERFKATLDEKLCDFATYC